MSTILPTVLANKIVNEHCCTLIQVSLKFRDKKYNVASDNGLMPNKVTSHHLNQWWTSVLIYICIYESLGFDKLSGKFSNRNVQTALYRTFPWHIDVK